MGKDIYSSSRVSMDLLALSAPTPEKMMKRIRGAGV